MSNGTSSKASASKTAPRETPKFNQRELDWIQKQGSTRCIDYQTRTRRRVFTPKAVGKIICAMLDEPENPRFTRVGNFGQGDAPTPPRAVLVAQLKAEISRCLDLDEGRKAEQQAVAVSQLGEITSSFVQENQTILLVTAGVLGALLFLPRLISVLPATVAAALPFAARQLITQIPGVLARVEVQQAANASFLRIVAALK